MLADSHVIRCLKPFLITGDRPKEGLSILERAAAAVESGGQAKQHHRRPDQQVAGKDKPPTPLTPVGRQNSIRICGVDTLSRLSRRGAAGYGDSLAAHVMVALLSPEERRVLEPWGERASRERSKI